MSYNVHIKDAIKKYGDFTAINTINLDIKKGELFTLLGPSGCGKTTLLRMIAGFNTIEGGTISFNEEVINNLAPHKRDTGMVFQNYAIFPHLSVFNNVAYGLKAKKIPSEKIEPMVLEALRLVHIEELKDRQPNELSGGQQQRVALARAIVIEPKALLMDEPLSNLDAKLRVQMRTVIRQLQQRLGITTVYVTHDQEEALAISDRIAVMDRGNIMQVDSPINLYNNPANIFVAGFIGISNFLDVEIINEHGVKKIKVGDNYAIGMDLEDDFTGKAILSARPEQVYFAQKDQGIKAKVMYSTFLGDFIEYDIELEGGQTLQVNEYAKMASKLYEDGDEVFIRFSLDKVNIYNHDTGEVIK